METVSYGEFSQTFHERTMRQHLPLSGTIEVTRRCPLTCVHCYNNLPMADREARRSELTFEEHCRVLDQLADAGCLWLLFTGGEIFARRDFLDIYIYAKKKGFLITLFTNGTLITPRVADTLAAWRPFAIEITLYGRTRETYERLTGIPGSYDKCLRGIELLLERKLPLALKSVAVTVNVHEIRAMQQFAADLGVNFKFDGMMNPRIDCSQSPLAVRLSPEDCVALDLEDPGRMEEWREFAKAYLRPANPPERADEVYHCGGGVTSFAIDPQGGLSICVLSQRDKFDLRQGSVQEAWRALAAVRRRKITAPTKCTMCELKSMCGMCPANGELESGDPEAPVDFLCRVAHLRAHSFGLPVAPHGTCEYCEGGSGHDEIMRSAERLKRVTPATPSSDRPRLLPVLAGPSEGGCGSGGCSSCSAHG
jgi:radical SAM protein with 4Fe4S-binding SPASM domain